jgi:hypothetical protein
MLRPLVIFWRQHQVLSKPDLLLMDLIEAEARSPQSDEIAS